MYYFLLYTNGYETYILTTKKVVDTLMLSYLDIYQIANLSIKEASKISLCEFDLCDLCSQFGVQLLKSITETSNFNDRCFL